MLGNFCASEYPLCKKERENCSTYTNDEALLTAALTGFTWSSVMLVEHLG